MSNWKNITCDIETNGLAYECTKLWCISLCDNETGEVELFSDEQLGYSDLDNKKTYPQSFRPLKEAIEVIEKAEQVVGHNFLAFDKIVLDKFYPNINWPRIVDTLVLSRLYDPELGKFDMSNKKNAHGGHSVKAWAKRLQTQEDKIEYNDWKNYSPLIPIRCKNDTLIQRQMYLKLREMYAKRKQDGFNYSEAIRLEHDVQEVVGIQEFKGWTFDVDKCKQLIDSLEKNLCELEKRLHSTMPPRVVPGNEMKTIFKKNGEYTENVKKYFGTDNIDWVGGAFSRISFPTIDLGSSQQVRNYLLTIGWKPDEWNLKRDKYNKPMRDAEGNYIKTTPKITLTSLESISIDGEDLKIFLKTRHRRNQLIGLLERCRPNGRIPATVNTIGTNTHRMTHIGVANIPKASPDVFLGKEMRSLFKVDSQRILVGVDQSSLEARIFASILGDKTVIYEITNGDIHTHTQQQMGLETRNQAKTLLYLVLYGGGAAKAAQASGLPGEEVISRLELAYPGLKDLRKEFTIKGKRGWIKAIDGRKLVIREDYRTFNTFIQSTGSIITKKAYVMMYRAFCKYKLDAYPVGMFHDEVQISSSIKDKEMVKKICKAAMIKAGEYYKLKCPLDAEVKEGLSWDQTH